MIGLEGLPSIFSDENRNKCVIRISASSEASISGEAKSKKRRRKEASGEDEKLPLKEIAKRIKLVCHFSVLALT